MLAPKPFTPGGPPVWGGGGAPGMIERSGKFFDDWFPAGSGGPASWGEGWTQVKAHAREAGRDPATLVGAAYLTLSINDDESEALAKLDGFLQEYYKQPRETIRRRQYCFAGSRSGVMTGCANSPRLVRRTWRLDLLGSMKSRWSWWLGCGGAELKAAGFTAWNAPVPIHELAGEPLWEPGSEIESGQLP